MRTCRLFCFFDDFSHAPVFILGKLARFDYSYLVALAALVVFVVRLETRGFGYRLFIEGVLGFFDPQKTSGIKERTVQSALSSRKRSA